jgi:hypothetical protein
MIATLCRAGSIILLLAAGASAADGLTAIATPGSGTLTMCRNWLLFNSCRDYNNVPLPSRIAVGDAVPLSFGSNPKDYAFPVKRITRDGDTCAVLSNAAGDSKTSDRIEVPSCQDASGTH